MVSGNHLAGGYTLSEEEISNSSLTEIGGNDSTSFTLLETSGNEVSVVRVGNEITGAFDFEETSSPTASLHHEGSNDLGTFTLDHANSTTITAVGWGNDIVGDYSIESAASDFYAWTQTNDGGVTYSLHAEGVNVRNRMAVGNNITQEYSVDEVGSDSFTLQQSATTDVSIDAEEVYTLTEQGNQASGLFAREASSTLTFERWIDAVDDAGTVSYSLEAAGDFLVGSLSLTETGDTRYSLLEAFNNTASGQNGAAPGNVDYSPFGAGFNINETAELPTGGMASPTGGAAVYARRGSALTNPVGSQAANIEASTGAVGIAEWQTGRELSGAATIDKYASYGAELFKTFCFSDDTPLLVPGGHKAIAEFTKGDAILTAHDNNATAGTFVGIVEEVFTNRSPVLCLRVNGKAIRTTGEHPIFAWGRGWVPAASLRAGDRVRSHNGAAGIVEQIEFTPDVVTVYNLRVSVGHTYFIGEAAWGWSLWAHNGDKEDCKAPENSQAGPVAESAPAENNQGEAGANSTAESPQGEKTEPDSDVPAEVVDLQKQQQDVLDNQQQELKKAIEAEGAKGKGKHFNELGKTVEDLAHEVVKQATPEGAKGSTNAEVGKGKGGRVDDKVVKDGVTVLVETKYSLPKKGEKLQRLNNQLSNATNAAGQNGKVILNVAKPPTQKQLDDFMGQLPANAAAKVVVVSSLPGLYKAVQGAFGK